MNRQTHPRSLRRRALGLLAALLALASMTGGGIVLAADESGRQVDAANDGKLRAALDVALARDLELRAQLRDPAARATRERSRTAFEDLAGRDAVALGRQGFPSALSSDVWEGPDFQHGERIERYLSDTVARISRPGEVDALLASRIPLLAKDESGAKHPVELALEDHGSFLQSVNPLVPVRFSKDPGAGMTLESSGVGLRLVGVGSEAWGTEDSSRLVVPDALRDTDLWAAPTPKGFETFTVLRSASSPEDLAYDVQLPAGAELRALSDGGAEVVRGPDRLASILAPTAFDADHQPVPVEMTVSGSQLRLRVAHRDADMRYPLLVDPTVQDDWDWNGGSDTSAVGWAGYTNHPGSFDSAYLDLPGRYGPALYVYTRTGSLVSNGEWSGWYFDPPGTSSYIYRAEMKMSTNALSACVYRGISDGYDVKVNCSSVLDNYTVSCVLSTCDPNAGAAGNHAYMRLQSTNTSTRTDATKAIAGLLTANVFYSDRDDPSFAGLNSGGTGTAWVRSYSGQITGSVTDAGVGLTSFEAGVGISGGNPNAGVSVISNPADGPLECEASVHDPCPTSLPATNFIINTESPDLADEPAIEGKQTINVVARDFVGHAPTGTWGQLWLDRTSPNVALSGSLYNGRVVAEPGTALASGNYSLQIQATDGVQGGAPSARQSGVKSVEVLVDGETALAPDNVSCPPATTDSCPDTRNWTFSTGAYSAGRHTITVIAKDQVGNPETEESFDVILPSAGELVTPVQDTTTSRWLQFQAHANVPGFSTVRFQYRRPVSGWQNVPQSALFDSQGQPVSTINHALANNDSPVVNWDMPLTWQLLGAQNGPLEVRAVFTGGLGAISEVVDVTFDARGLGSDNASDAIGPGSVDLLTGNFSYANGDASVESWRGMSVSRIFNSRDPSANSTGPFGPGWTTSVPVQGSSDYASVKEVSDSVNGSYVSLVLSDASELYFQPSSPAGSYPQTYTPKLGSEGKTLVKDSATQFTLTDSDGTTVIFVHQAAAPVGVYGPIEARAPGSDNTARITYDPATGRLQRLIAPAPAALNCSAAPLTTRGCRSLALVYAASTSATGTAEGSWGNYVGRLQRIDFTAWDRTSSTMTTDTVAQYLYDNAGKLRAYWDPRISPALKERYNYDAGGRLSQIDSASSAAWDLAYQALPGDADDGRLKSASQMTPQGVATTTVVYGVPVSGVAAPYQMGAGDLAALAQTDTPVAATAVFPPDSVPANPPTSYARAAVHYTDYAGREVNTVVPGGATSTIEYDRYGNAIRELSPTNRARALASGGLSAQVAQTLDTRRTYVDNGQEMVDELGPEHDVKLENGSTVRARRHTVVVYDEGAPPNSNPHLPTTTTTSAQVVGGPASADARVSKVEYDWTLRKPTKTIADYGGLNITRQKTYAAATGHELTSTMPKQGSRVRQTTYYSAPSAPEWANLPASRLVQGGTVDSDLPAQSRVSYNAYNRLNQVTSQTKWDDDRPTTTITGFDAAGRTLTSSITGPAADPTGLVAGYGFEEASGSASDMSGNNNLGTLGNGAIRATSGRFGKALELDGVDDHMLVNGSASLRLPGDMTLEAWVRPTALTGQPRPIITKTGVATGCSVPGYTMLASGTGAAGALGPRGTWCNGSVTTSDDAQLSTGVWSHLAVTKSGTSLKVYVNGVQVASGSAGTGLPSSTGTLYIGQAAVGHFAGLVDELRIYNRALSGTEIAVDMHRPVDPDRAAPTIPAPLSGLKAAYGFEGQASSSFLRDSSPLGNHGSIGARAPGGRVGSGLAEQSWAMVPDSPSLDVSAGVTAEAWLDPDPATSNAFLPTTILDKPGSYALRTAALGSKVQFTIGWGASSMTISAPVTPYQASHVVGTFDGATLKIFVDGVQKTSHTLAVPKTIAVGTSDLVLGGYSDFRPEQRIDEVRIYDRALTATEIQQDSNAQIAAPYVRPPTPTALPVITNTYDSATGLPATTSTTENGVTKTISVGYDSLGRPTGYTDADGNTSTTAYDLLGRPTTTNDGKGTQTFTYDATTALLTQLVDSHAGTFTASYGPGDELTSQTLPNGLRADTVYSETETPTDLVYTKQSCSSNCVWYEEHVEQSIHGQWLSRDSSMSDQQYAYDKLGRLTQVKDTPAGQGCTTRSYAYDANSNRTSMTTRAPGAGGACDTVSAGTVQASTYDSADRITSDGFVYDSYSRITTVPPSHAGGTALKTSYYVNDMVKTHTQGTVSKGWLLDPTQTRYRATIPSGSSQSIMHYSDASDTPAWTDIQTNGATVSWNRHVTGIDGGLAAITSYNAGTTTTELRLSNLHGDLVATASVNPATNALLSTFESDEFGNPRQTSDRTFGWLGAAGRRTVMPSGVVQMGVRSYVPGMGRFTTTDPVTGGSANDYDYANADPMNSFDLDGMRARARPKPKCYIYAGGAKRQGAVNVQAEIKQTFEWCVRESVIISKKAYRPSAYAGFGWKAIGRWTRSGGGGKGHTYWHAVTSRTFQYICVKIKSPFGEVGFCPQTTLTIDVYMYSDGTMKRGPSQTGA